MKKSSPPSAPAGKQYTWDVYHIKGTPAALLGRVEAPDEESAIRKAIEEFEISPALQKRLSCSGGEKLGQGGREIRPSFPIMTKL
jgi:hypothetical protein